MALSVQQRKRVAWLIDGHLADDYDEATFWTRWEREFAALSSPEELFLFASESHPSQGPEEWRRVLDSPLCDMGTALLVFWRNDPFYHYGHASRDEVPDMNRGSYDLVREIEQQADQCLRNIQAALAEAGATLADVVRVTYVLPRAEEFRACWPILRRYFGEIRPAAMMISAGLADPRMRIEIEVTARIGSGGMPAAKETA
jgi:enamine deaminase RidA (YjgF/YER057c/UK114 family)